MIKQSTYKANGFGDFYGNS